MRIRLTRKFAEFIDGIDLRHRRVGQIIDVPAHEAELLLAEEWASPADDAPSRATADDAPRRSRKQRAE